MLKNSERKAVKVEPLTDLKMDTSWDEHINAVYPAIKELDRRQAESVAQASFIVVTNATK